MFSQKCENAGSKPKCGISHTIAGRLTPMLCAGEKDMLEVELEQWREALEKRRMKVSRANTEYMCLNGTPLGSVKIQSDQLPQVTEFRSKQEDTVWME